MSRILLGTGLLCSSLVGSVASAQNNGLPSHGETVVLMISIAERGLECGLLLPWESLALKVQVLQAEAERLTAAQRLEAGEEVLVRKAEMACDNVGLTGYIEAVRPGIEREILPPFLVIYHTLASQESPPDIFTAAAPRLTYRAPIARIEDEFAEQEARGYAPEGGGSWEEYRAQISQTIVDAMQSAGTDEASPSSEVRSALNYIPMSAIIVEAWLADIGGGPE